MEDIKELEKEISDEESGSESGSEEESGDDEEEDDEDASEGEGAVAGPSSAVAKGDDEVRSFLSLLPFSTSTHI